MKILMVSPWLPYPPQRWGAVTRVYQVLRHLSERHQVFLLAYGDEDEREAAAGIRRLGVEVHVVHHRPPAKRIAQLQSLVSHHSYEVSALRSRAMAAAFRGLVGRVRPDSVLIEFSQLAAALPPVDASLVVDEHNVEYELHRRLAGVESGVMRKVFHAFEYTKLRLEEASVWRRAGACLVTSVRERDMIRRRARGTTVEVVPNGVDLTYYDGHPVGEVEAESIVFVGQMRYRPNADAAVHFAKRILPSILETHPAARFYVVGQDPPAEVLALAGRNVVVTGRVDDVRGYVRRAAAVVAPIRAGSGTRLKILEALALRKAVIATTLAAEGLDLRPGREILLADEPRAYAQQVTRVMEDPSLAARLGEEGRASVERKYSWPVVLRQLDAIFPAARVAHPRAAAPVVAAGTN